MRSWLSSAGERGLAGAQFLLEGADRGLGDALRTTRFLRGKLTFRPRVDDVYVVTYPRSGTTWVQFVLHLLRAQGEPLGFHHISQVSPWWERSMALGSRRSEDFEALDAPRIFKSHLPRGWLPGPGRFIYVVRDGLDVAVSYYELYRSHLGFDGSFEAFFERFLRGRVQYGSWFRHVEGWRRYADDPKVLMVRYEDLRSDLDDSAARFAEFLGWSRSPEAIRQACAQASFSAMKAHEEKFDPITETLLDQGLHRGRFLRSGRSGDGARAVTEDMRSRFEALRGSPQRLPHLEARLPDFLH
ncbi:MAG: sulfotransferase domain-containing protein [Myxococcota bacterium]